MRTLSGGTGAGPVGLPAGPGPDPLQSPPGLPAVHSWPAMYAVVLATFVLWDALLTSLSWFFP